LLEDPLPGVLFTEGGGAYVGYLYYGTFTASFTATWGKTAKLGDFVDVLLGPNPVEKVKSLLEFFAPAAQPNVTYKGGDPPPIPDSKLQYKVEGTVDLTGEAGVKGVLGDVTANFGFRPGGRPTVDVHVTPKKTHSYTLWSTVWNTLVNDLSPARLAKLAFEGEDLFFKTNVTVAVTYTGPLAFIPIPGGQRTRGGTPLPRGR
jgi:hypothetical protein